MLHQLASGLMLHRVSKNKRADDGHTLCSHVGRCVVKFARLNGVCHADLPCTRGFHRLGLTHCNCSKASQTGGDDRLV